MTFAAKAPPPGGGGGAVALSFPGGKGDQPSTPPAKKQGKKRAYEITCAAMRAQELRECLTRELSHVMAIALQAQAALFDGDDDAALACLFRHWFALRDDVRPLLVELRDVKKQGGAR